MNTLYFSDCLDVLKELHWKFNINLEVPNWHHKLPGFGEMLTFKSATKRLDGENGENVLFDEK